MSSIESFNIRKFSKYIVDPQSDAAGISTAVAANSWYHYPQRSGLAVTFIIYNQYTDLFVYNKGERLERVRLENGAKDASFISQYPSLGFKQIRTTGRVNKRFQVGFADINEFNKCCDTLKKLELTVIERDDASQFPASQFSASQLQYPASQAPSASQMAPPGTQLTQFGTHVPLALEEGLNLSPQRESMALLDGPYRVGKPQGISETLKMEDAQLKRRIAKLLKNKEFIKLVYRLDKLVSQ